MEMEGSVTKGMEGLCIPFRGIRRESRGGGKGGGNELDAKINPNSSGMEGERKEVEEGGDAGMPGTEQSGVSPLE